MPQNDAFLRLVFGDDGSSSAGIAWAWICAQSWPGWELVVLHARPPEIPKASIDPATELPRSWTPPDELLRVPPETSSFVRTSYLVCDADPRIALYRVENPSLTVVGAGRLASPLSLLLGSTARYLLADPPSALAVIKKAGPVRKVVAALDGSPSAFAALEAFSRFPWAKTCDVTLVTVLHRDVEDVDDIQDRGTEILSPPLERPRITRRILEGRPAKALSDYLASLDSEPDLVVAGTRGHSPLPRPHIGSVTYALAHRDDWNLMVARS